MCHQLQSPATFAVAIVFTLFAQTRSALANEQDALFSAKASAYQAAVAEAAPSVLRIETFGGLEKVDKVLIGSGPTTGLAVSSDGYILSSAFNFIQQPNSILVTMPSGKRAAAQIVARDESRMLVLLKVNSDEELTVPNAVAREKMVVGQTVIAVGRTFDSKQPNLSVGILSAKDRIWGKAIQTDAKVSPANYGGPLINLSGEVLGILAPMSPQGREEVAGAEWYDSGIGFAVPLADILPRLEQMKQGRDLKPGLLGVSLKGEMYKGPIEIAARSTNSPAAKAGLEKGDNIVAINGQRVRWESELRHQLGRHYAGDTVQITVTRGKKQFEANLELAAEIEPFDVSFLGILPMRKIEGGQGVAVRYVYAGSPADEAGIVAGDRIVQAGDTKVNAAEQLRDLVGTFPGTDNAKLAMTIERNGKPREVQLALSSLPTTIPDDLPSAYPKTLEDAAKGENPATGLIDFQLADEPNQIAAVVPRNYDQRRNYGLLVTLHAPGEFRQDSLTTQWQDVCDDYHLIVLAPRATKDDQWETTEVDLVVKAIEEIKARYQIDPLRIATHGYQAGGTMGQLVAFQNPGLIRGVAAVDAVPPQRSAPPEADPVNRVAYYVAVAEESPARPPSEAGVEQLKKMKQPVTVRKLGKQPRRLNKEERRELARWLDCLDRI